MHTRALSSPPSRWWTAALSAVPVSLSSLSSRGVIPSRLLPRRRSPVGQARMDRRDLTYPSFLVDATNHLHRVPTGRQLNPFRRFHIFSTVLTRPGTEAEFNALAHGLLSGAVHRTAGAALAEYSAHSTDRIGPGDVVTVTFCGLKAPCLVLEAGVRNKKDRKRDAEALVARLTYGTLPGHMECGEEYFELTYREGVLTARVVAFSRAGRWFTRLGGPAARTVQRLMARRYARALLR